MRHNKCSVFTIGFEISLKH